MGWLKTAELVLREQYPVSTPFPRFQILSFPTSAAAKLRPVAAWLAQVNNTLFPALLLTLLQ